MSRDLSSRQKEILEGLSNKPQIKLKVYDRTLEAFNLLKEILKKMSNILNDYPGFRDGDERITLDYRDRGKFEAELNFADDVLIFSMHPNVFLFDRDHAVWKGSFLKDDPNNGFCGIVSIYNFLFDSIKYNRVNDLGYMVARIFINKDGFYLVEGKRQQDNDVNIFGKKKLGKEELQNIVETAILYTLSFDLLVPPFDLVKMASVEQINDKIESARHRTGKRMGFRFNSDDVLKS